MVGAEKGDQPSGEETDVSDPSKEEKYYHTSDDNGVGRKRGGRKKIGRRCETTGIIGPSL